MSLSRKPFVMGSIAIALGLLLSAAGYKTFSLMSVRIRPWYLEGYAQSRIADCRTGPGASFFRKELTVIAENSANAGQCIAETEKRPWFRRDYSRCISMLLSTGLDAQLLSLKLEQRKKDQERKLDVLIRTLSYELSANGLNDKIWTRFNMPNSHKEKAGSLLKQAKFLQARGEIEAALTLALGGWVFWNRFSYQSDADFARFEDPVLRTKWEKQVQQLLTWTRRSGRRAILVDKLGHFCLLIHKGKIQKRFTANLSRNWYHRKARSQDASTPEGEYKVTRLIPSGKYGKALMLDYPNVEDRKRFQILKRDGTITQEAHIGRNIEIHGKGIPETDWTDGCVSLEDKDMQELYKSAYVGMPVTIVGTSDWTFESRN
jgi:hypothetical protein